jgi:hypothetical protein
MRDRLVPNSANTVFVDDCHANLRGLRSGGDPDPSRPNFALNFRTEPAMTVPPRSATQITLKTGALRALQVWL